MGVFLDIIQIGFFALFIAYGIKFLYQKYMIPTVNVTDILDQYHKLISIFAYKNKQNKGIVWISSPILINRLQKVKVGWIPIDDADELIMDYIPEKKCELMLKEWYKNKKQIKAVISLLNDYNPKKQMIRVTTFPGLPIRAEILNLDISE